MTIPETFLESLRDASGDALPEVVGRYVELRKAGSDFKGSCPFHSERTPSFSVSPSRGTYHCFGCGAHGDAVSFLMEHASLPFVEAVREVARTLGIAVPTSANHSTPRRQTTLTAREALALLERESMLIAVAAANIARGVQLTDEDRKRVLSAAGRIAAIREEHCNAR